MTVLEVDGCTRSFGGIARGRRRLVPVRRGEMLALIGPNGAGKSTCFDSHRPVAPRRRQRAPRRRRRHRPARRAIWPPRASARTFQIAAIFASMTVRENVQVALMSHARTALAFWACADAAFRGDADGLLARSAWTTQADRAAGVLAYGDLKRLELAIALAAGPACC